MARLRPIIFTLAATALLGACGSKEDLKPVAGQPAAAIPVGAKRAPTTEELTTPDAQAKPARSDELLKRSEQREPDDFDLPPPG
ncbi:hypothetical protein L7H23_14680 [Sphingopyxis sp. BSN-002]|uniref:hypothetical protein n=1 Tax=Sphingopyxis sp. BSN-002 TaxID=2911495 RepID=UPI001EDBFD87|nr:hypothetical protein [Sphingopyxis sp. BSN-002]UKK83800.1 hypothetical protein L7H23_14680 [Sphingopyxis sp. BSN-002]